MSYGSHSLAKLDYARYLAACLVYFSNKQRDRVGLVTFDHDVVDYVPSSMKHLDTILHTLDRAKAGRPGSLQAPLLKITEMLGRKGILVVISDFYQEPDDVLRAVGPLRARGHDEPGLAQLGHVLDQQRLRVTDGDQFHQVEFHFLHSVTVHIK